MHSRREVSTRFIVVQNFDVYATKNNFTAVGSFKWRNSTANLLKKRRDSYGPEYVLLT
jgi:hypothetical protein